MKLKITVCVLVCICIATFAYATYRKDELDLFVGGFIILFSARVLVEFESELKEKKWYRVLTGVATIAFVSFWGLYLLGFHGHL